MASDVMPRAVLFDIGGVLVTDGPDGAEVARLMGCGTSAARADAVTASLWAHRDAYDLGQSDADYWGAVAADVGAAPLSAEVIAALTRVDVERWSRPDAAVVGLIRELDAAGIVVGVLSNAPTALARAFCGESWTSVLGAAVFSCDLGIAKPDLRIYAAAVAQAGVAASEAVFFDDRSVNVAAATDAGLTGILWRSLDDARSRLRAMGVPIAG